MSLHLKFILIIGVLSVLLLGTVLFFVSSERDVQFEYLRGERESRVLGLRTELLDRVRFYESSILTLANTPPIQGIYRASQFEDHIDPLDGSSLETWQSRLETIFSSFIAASPHYKQIRFLDAKGMEIIRVNSDQTGLPVAVSKENLQDKSDRPYFIKTVSLKKGQVYNSDFEFNVENGEVVLPLEPTFRVSLPLYSEIDETLFGIIVVNVDAYDFFSVLNTEKTGAEESILLRDQNGRYLLNTSGGKTSVLVSGESHNNTSDSLLPNGYGNEVVSEIFRDSKTGGEKMRILTRVQLNKKNDIESFLTLESETDVKELYYDINRHFLISLILFCALGLLLSILLYLLFVRTVIARVTANLKAVNKIREGDLSVQIDVDSKDEIAQVAVGINEMVKSLSEHEDQLRLNQEKLRETNKEFKTVNESLQSTQRAVLNILEDLNTEKDEIEHRVFERTIELEQEREKLSHVTQNMLAGAILLNGEKKPVFVNTGAYQMFKAKNNPNDLLSKISKVLLINSSEDIDSFLKLASETGTVTCEVETGQKIFEILFKALNKEMDEKKHYVGYLILIRDITDERLLERSKSELVAVASHQLRTPLTAMRGNVEMLTDGSYGKLNNEQLELLNDIEISTIRLISMVNDMLDITKIEKGDLELAIEQFNVKEVIDSVLEDLSDYARRHNFTIKQESPKNEPRIYGDRVRVRQVLQNLIDNSIKYCRKPGILEIKYNQLENNLLSITLKDNGIGIPKAEQSNMFGRFYRASNTSKVTSSGSGLGLYIVKSIVEQHHGSIRFESEEGVGTTFYVTFPTNEIKGNNI